MLEKAEIAKTMGEGALGDLTREPVRTLGFIGDYAFSTREPLENNVKDGRRDKGIRDFAEELEIVK